MMQNYIMHIYISRAEKWRAQQETKNLKVEEEKLEDEKEKLTTLQEEIAQELKMRQGSQRSGYKRYGS